MQVSLLINWLAEMPPDAEVLVELSGCRSLLQECCEEPELGVVLLIADDEDYET